MKDRVSIIIPCFNNKKTLELAIKSALSQTYNDCEIIVINDCSNESYDIEKIIDKYKDELIYIKNKHNLGPAGSRNIGVDISTGNYLAFIDADDQIHPKKIEYQMSLITQENIVTTSHYKKITKLNFDINKIPVRITNSPLSLILRKNLCGAAMLIHKRLFYLLDRYNSNYRIHEDLDFYLRALGNNIPIININLPLYLYNKLPSSLSSNDEFMRNEELIIRNYFKTKIKSKSKLNLLFFTITLLYYFKRTLKFVR